MHVSMQRLHVMAAAGAVGASSASLQEVEATAADCVEVVLPGCEGSRREVRKPACPHARYISQQSCDSPRSGLYH